MASPGPSSDYAGRPISAGPALAFAGSTGLAVAAFALFARTLQPHAVLPALVTLLFALTALVALAGWLLPKAPEMKWLNYWDVAGALAFVGIGLSVLIEPEQVAALIGGIDGRR
jgi:hypothetical protein